MKGRTSAKALFKVAGNHRISITVVALVVASLCLFGVLLDLLHSNWLLVLAGLFVGAVATGARCRIDDSNKPRLERNASF